jgi:hypothetical protein
LRYSAAAVSAAATATIGTATPGSTSFTASARSLRDRHEDPLVVRILVVVQTQ